MCFSDMKFLKKLLSAGDVQNAGSVLDRVISQPHTEEHTVLYKLADYKKGNIKSNY